jgi:adenylate cyclase
MKPLLSMVLASTVSAACATARPASDGPFYDLIDARIEAEKAKDTAQLERIDGEIKRDYEQPLAVMITDLSGFSAKTKEHGILFFLTGLRQWVKRAQPVIEKHGAVLVKVDADDLFVTHHDADRLLALAFDLQNAMREYNAATGNDFGLAVGLGYGPTLVLPGDIFGNSVNTSSRLGEDLARGGEVLVTEELYAALKDRSRCSETVDPREAPLRFHACKAP